LKESRVCVPSSLSLRLDLVSEKIQLSKICETIREMGKLHATPPIALGNRKPGATLTQWLYEELRSAILNGRLQRGVRLPATRELAAQYHVSRRTAVTVFEQLRDEGYTESRTGAGTIVSNTLPEDFLQLRKRKEVRHRPAPVDSIRHQHPSVRPLHPIYPSVTEFPIELWTRLASRRLRRLTAGDLSAGDVAGYRPLRQAIAEYVGASRGINCVAEQIIVTSGMHQGLDLVARTALKPGDRVWVEDPGYQGAIQVILSAGATVVPIPVDEKGLNVDLGRERADDARAAFVTPGHQCPLGSTMSLDRRLALLQWARERRAIVIEDDYDSEFRFRGHPTPALQSLDRNGSIVVLGSFNKVMFPALRFGYIVAPETLLDRLLGLRWKVDRYPDGPHQAVLCDFIEEGHFARHLRRMRELYAHRWRALHDSCNRYLAEYFAMPMIEAGLNTPAYLKGKLTSRQAEIAASAVGVQTVGLDRFSRERRDIRGLLLGFAAFNEKQIQEAAKSLRRALAGKQSSHVA
jgi:GntR family transcriptional regulator/MocR family aminotransferase